MAEVLLGLDRIVKNILNTFLLREILIVGIPVIILMFILSSLGEEPLRYLEEVRLVSEELNIDKREVAVFDDIDGSKIILTPEGSYTVTFDAKSRYVRIESLVKQEE